MVGDVLIPSVVGDKLTPSVVGDILTPSVVRHTPVWHVAVLEGITKVTISFFHRGPCGMRLLYSKSPLRRRVSLGGQLPASVAKAFVIAPGSSLLSGAPYVFSVCCLFVCLFVGGGGCCVLLLLFVCLFVVVFGGWCVLLLL